MTTNQAAPHPGEAPTPARALRDSMNSLTSVLNDHALRLSMLRTTVEAFLQAALHNEEDRDAAPIDIIDMMKVLATILPSEDFYEDQLMGVLRALRCVLPDGAAETVQPQRVPPAQLLVDAVKAASGDQADPKKLLSIGDELFGYSGTEYIAVADAFSAALDRQGWAYEVVIQRGKKTARLVRAEAPSAAPSRPARKRDRLAEVARA